MNCQAPTCQKDLNWFRVKLLNKPGYYLESNWYCSEECLEKGILQRLRKINRQPEKTIQNLMRIKLGHILLENGLVTVEQLEKAMAERLAHNELKLGQCLLSLGYIKEHDITVALSRQYGLPVINVTAEKIDAGVLKLIPPVILRNGKFVPVEYDEVNGNLLLVTSDPGDVSTIINLRSLLGCDTSIYLSDDSIVQLRIRTYCELAESAGVKVEEIQSGKPSNDFESLASLLVDRAMDLEVRSLNFRYFNHLIWARYQIEDESLDLVVHTLPH
jgi:hypothetical protein